MASSYKGLYSIKTEAGIITDVQVEAPGGHSLPLPIDIYRERGVEPPAESLPDQNAYSASRSA
ncbi:hypothetical protein DUPY_02790 [Duganella phyllosphaerae]|uniref:Uncharacterized protein n=1 Tax=Duganella phyllosphaerae TaxID=762836 RepID=A0A1E7X7C7_9BURK|nr:hypothetical protein DUPY_02790 [Duganella phyllosphaerae]